MEQIDVNDLNEAVVISDQEAAEVKGGPIYMKYEGIKGNVSNSAHSGGANFAFGDGSVRF